MAVSHPALSPSSFMFITDAMLWLVHSLEWLPLLTDHLQIIHLAPLNFIHVSVPPGALDGYTIPSGVLDLGYTVWVEGVHIPY